MTKGNKTKRSKTHCPSLSLQHSQSHGRIFFYELITSLIPHEIRVQYFENEPIFVSDAMPLIDDGISVAMTHNLRYWIIEPIKIYIIHSWVGAITINSLV